jgi:hypothetical protein
LIFLRGQNRGWQFSWCRWEGSNLRPNAYETSALPLSYIGNLLRGSDLHRRSSGYGPDEILLLYPALILYWILLKNQLYYNLIDMNKKIEAVQKMSFSEITAAQNPAELEKIRIKYLGRKGELTAVLRSLKDLPLDERRQIGPLAQKLKKELEEKLEKKSKKYQVSSIKYQGIDITKPAQKIKLGHLHPLSKIEEEIRQILLSMTNSVVEIFLKTIQPGICGILFGLNKTPPIAINFYFAPILHRYKSIIWKTISHHFRLSCRAGSLDMKP